MFPLPSSGWLWQGCPNSGPCQADRCLSQGGLGLFAALMSPCFSVQGCSVETALEAASLHPAQLLGIEHKKGTLNYDADAGTGVGTAGTGMGAVVRGLVGAGAKQELLEMRLHAPPQ